MINTPMAAIRFLSKAYMQTVAQLTLPFYDISPRYPVHGGGVHPGMVEKSISGKWERCGSGCRGAVQGHPGGAAAGSGNAPGD